MQNALDTHLPAYTAAFPYYEENRRAHRAYGEDLVAAIRAHGARRILSLGVGHSEVARCILAELRLGRIERYCIVEGSAAILDEFRRTHAPLPEGLELWHEYFETFAYPERIDLIEAGFILEHVEDPALVLGRLKDFLAPQGRILAAVPNARSLHRLLGHMAGLLPDLYALSQADLELGHKRYFDRERLIRLAEECGYQVIRTWGILLKPFTTAQLAMLDLSPAIWDALTRVARDYPDIAHAVCIEMAPA